MSHAERIFEDYRKLPKEEQLRFRRLILLADGESTEENAGAFLGEEMMAEIEQEAEDAWNGKIKTITVDDIDGLIDRELGLA